MKKYFFFGIFLLMIKVYSYSQENYECRNKIYKDNIKTVLLYREGWEFSYPIIDLKSDKHMILEFDDLNNVSTDYSYTFIHCDSEWKPSILNPVEYIKGFEEEQILDYESSFNTLVQYTHYRLSLPNENMQPIISGNYILLVYEGYDRDNPIISRRFYVVDEQIVIDATEKRSSIVNSINDSQEIEIKLYDKKGIIYNPQDHLKVVTLQNNNQEIYIDRFSPDYIKGNTFEYNNPRKMRFKGGNEYRYFNVKNTKYLTDRFHSILFNKPYYIFELIRERPKPILPYTYAQDINGEMLIVADYIDNYELEADYVYVDFTLDYDFELTAGNFYVYGAISGWEINKRNKMSYDFGDKAYKLRMLLKQGFYNYEYIYVGNNEKVIDLSLTEGNHYETENNYVIYVYYKPQGSEYDQLIGYKIINSLKRL